MTKMQGTHIEIVRAMALLVALLVALLAAPAAVRVQADPQTGHEPPQVVSDGDALWALRAEQAGDPPRRRVLIQRLTRRSGPDDAHGPSLTPVGGLVGQLADPGAAAASGVLWLIFTDGSVQTLRLDPTPSPTLGSPHTPGTSNASQTSGGTGYAIIREAPLPAPGLRLHALAADARGLWVLATATDADALAAVNQLPQWDPRSPHEPPAVRTATPRATRRPPPFIVPSPPEAQSPLKAEPPPQAPSPAEAESQAAPPAPNKDDEKPAERLVLLRLVARQWSRTSPPPDLGPLQRITMFADIEATPPTLVTENPDAPGIPGPSGAFVRHRFVQGAWEHHNFTMPGGEGTPVADLRFVLLPPYLAAAQRRADQPGLHVNLALVTPEETVVALGTLDLPDAAHRPWFLAPWARTLALVGVDADGQLQHVRIDTAGQSAEPATALPVTPAPAWPALVNQVMVIAMLALATLVLFSLWRKDPRGGQVQLPEPLKDADLLVRALAGAIDLTPGVALAMWWFDLDARTFLAHWPGLDSRLTDQLAPAAAAVAVFVTYSFLAELFFATTPGKAIFRLKVVSVDGSPPNLWQVLGRNVTKAFDLFAFLLLLLPLVNPHRQRLGDLVARTVVVRPIKPQ